MRHLQCFTLALLLTSVAMTASAQMLWQGARYGMSVREVQSIHQRAVPPPSSPLTILDGSVERLRLLPFELLEKPFTVSFLFRGERLRHVRIHLVGPAAAMDDLFSPLVQGLQGKYGQGQRDEQRIDGKLINASAKWRQGNTEVLLSVWYYSLNVDLSITYSSVPTQGIEKL